MAFKNLKLLKFILLVVIAFNVFSVVLSQKDKYFSSNYWQEFPKLKKVFYDSVYKNKDGEFISDTVVYSYAAGSLARGESPILENPEAPPLGKYLIALSILIFGNPNIVIAFFAASVLVLMYLLGKQILKNDLLAVIPPVIFSFEPMFKNQIIVTPLLDIIQAAFLLAVFYFFNKSREKARPLLYTLLTVVFFGFFISTKFFGTGVSVVAALFLSLLIHKQWKLIKYYVLLLPLSALILLATYTRVLLDGYPLNKFLGIQKWVFLYNKGHVREPFSIWPLLLFNKWHTGGMVSFDSQWLITWPLITIVSFITFIVGFVKRKIKPEAEMLLFWSAFYLMLMTLVDATARYFVILFPVLYITATYGVVEFVKWRFPKFKI
jgi:predicted membrane-bound dolichyl-phosphate-mannose-protein mannosyltransferase